MSLILAGVTACTLLGSFSVQASEETASSADSTDSSAKTTTIGVAISSSTDTFGSQVKKLIDEAARVLDVSVNYCDHGDTASLVQEAPQMLIDSGCQGIVMVGADDSAMETALTACGNSRVYLAQAIGSISPSDGAVYQAAETSPWYIGAVDAAENLSDESGAESAAVQAESTVSASSSPAAAGTDQTAAGTAAAAAGTSAGTALTAYPTHRNGEFVEPLYAFLMVYSALRDVFCRAAAVFRRGNQGAGRRESGRSGEVGGQPLGRGREGPGGIPGVEGVLTAQKKSGTRHDPAGAGAESLRRPRFSGAPACITMCPYGPPWSRAIRPAA